MMVDLPKGVLVLFLALMRSIIQFYCSTFGGYSNFFDSSRGVRPVGAGYITIQKYRENCLVTFFSFDILDAGDFGGLPHVAENDSRVQGTE